MSDQINQKVLDAAEVIGNDINLDGNGSATIGVATIAKTLPDSLSPEQFEEAQQHGRVLSSALTLATGQKGHEFLQANTGVDEVSVSMDIAEGHKVTANGYREDGRMQVQTCNEVVLEDYAAVRTSVSELVFEESAEDAETSAA